MQIIRLAVAFILFAIFAAPSAAADGPRKFRGEITPSGCADRNVTPFKGIIANGRVKGVAARKREFDWPVSADGTFGGELSLRSHRLGENMQIYKARIEGDRLIVDVNFGVPGIPETQCTGHGEMRLR